LFCDGSRFRGHDASAINGGFSKSLARNNHGQIADKTKQGGGARWSQFFDDLTLSLNRRWYERLPPAEREG
jgi:hypothetical protein